MNIYNPWRNYILTVRVLSLTWKHQQVGRRCSCRGRQKWTPMVRKQCKWTDGNGRSRTILSIWLQSKMEESQNQQGRLRSSSHNHLPLTPPAIILFHLLIWHLVGKLAPWQVSGLPHLHASWFRSSRAKKPLLELKPLLVLLYRRVYPDQFPQEVTHPICEQTTQNDVMVRDKYEW